MKTKKVAVIGSTTFPLSADIGAQIVDEIRSLGQNVVILTRGSEGFDRFVMGVAAVLGIRCFTFPSEGGAHNWVRDVELAAASDAILAFVAPGDLDSSKETGTLHLIEKALDRKRSVKMFTEHEGELIWAAEN